MTPDHKSRWLEQGSLILGLLLLAVWFHDDFESRRFQSEASRRLGAMSREAESRAPASALRTAAFVGPELFGSPLNAMEATGVLGRLEIPRLRITAIVVEGTDDQALARAVGHVPSTARPGRPGNCGLAGHRDTFLRGLGGVRVNDLIRIVTVERTYLYQVEWSEVVEPQRVDTLDSTTTPALTLVTCYPFAFVGHAPKRFVVRARLVEAIAAPTPIEDPETPPTGTLAAERR